MTTNDPVATGRYKNNNNNQNRELSALKKKEHWMKWGLWSSAIVILLLFLVLGYATDWTRGLRKDTDLALSDTSLDSAQQPVGTDTSTAAGTNGQNGAGTNSSDKTTASETSNTSTTTNNTTTNNSTATPNEPPSNDIQTFYNGLGLGEALEAAIARAEALGLDVDCSETIVVRTCDVSDGDSTVTLRSLMGINDITSIINDFNPNP